MVKMVDLTSDIDAVGPVVPVERRGLVVPVRGGGRTRWLQDGRYIPSWLAWLRQRPRNLALALLLLVGVAALARLLLAGR